MDIVKLMDGATSTIGDQLFNYSGVLSEVYEKDGNLRVGFTLCIKAVPGTQKHMMSCKMAFVESKVEDTQTRVFSLEPELPGMEETADQEMTPEEEDEYLSTGESTGEESGDLEEEF